MASTVTSSDNKQPIKRLEIQINNFNVAIPHHVDLLKGHRNNIKKFQERQDWEQVRREQINVSRLIKQLKVLLYEMDTLRSQVQDSDIEIFDKLTANARQSIVTATQEYLELDLSEIKSRPCSPQSEDEPVATSMGQGDIELLDTSQKSLQKQEACLHAWNCLQNDMKQLHQLFIDFNRIVHDQKEQISILDNHIEEAHGNIEVGNKTLEKAAKYKVMVYPLAGAVLGTCIGGPIGLVAGLKFGGLAAIGCGILGFTGGTILKKKQVEIQKPSTELASQVVTESDEVSTKPKDDLQLKKSL